MLFFILVLMLAGFRWDVGIDWMAYYNMFGGEILGNDILAERMEPFNLISCAILTTNGFTDGRYWIWGMALINLFFVTKSISLYSKKVVISMLLYILLGFYFDSLNMVRQACAISIGLYGWQFIDKSLMKYMVTIGFATLFHSSAILLISLYFINKLSVSVKFLKTLVVVSILLAPVSTILAPKLILLLPMYQQYGDSSVIKYASGSGNILSYIRIVFPLFLMYLSICKWQAIERSDYRYIALNTICGLLVSIAFPTTQLMIRMSFYFTIGLIFYIPYLYDLFSIPIRKQLWTVTIVYYILYLSVNYLFSPVAKIIPYTLRFDLDVYKLLSLSLILLSLVIVFMRLIRSRNKVLKSSIRSSVDEI